ncbi:MAG: hypothetical protein HZB67_06210 [Candidatus Aenigmarchaeota archaeon]|nr:hypothetical protein [Candidatus Aenigmarchaeota archaeon]
MTKLTIQELTSYFRRVRTSETIPYKNSEMVFAVKDASSVDDFRSLSELSEAIEEGYSRANPTEDRKKMVSNARGTLATLAYLADHDPSPLDWMSLGPVAAFADEGCYGSAMSLLRKVYESREIDLMKDVFREEDKPSLN